MILVSKALADITEQLKLAGIEAPRREARILLAYALGTDAAGLLTRDEIDPACYAAPLARRAAREPLSYITGHKEFWGLDFLTSPATLIPRPDTETLLEAVLQSGHKPSRILDLGTGTGCLLLACLHEFSNAFGIGVDLNPDAARLAQRNAVHLGLSDRAAFFAGNWCQALTGRFDLILSNPPYIESAHIPALMPEVAAYEPNAALDGGADGLCAYHMIIGELPRVLAKNGQAVLEIGAGQAISVTEIAQKQGFDISLYSDISGTKRAVMLEFCK